MQITILSVAAKPQQFFKGKQKFKKKSISLSSLKYLNFEVSEGKVPMLVHVVFETRVKNPPQQETKRKKRSERRRGVVAGMLSTLCGSVMCCLLGQRHPWDRDFLGGFMTGSSFFAGLSARGVVSGPAGVIRCSDVVCSAPFLHARYPVSERSCKADKQRGSGRAAGGSLQAGWALPELRSHTASCWAGSQAEAQAHCSGLASPSCLKGHWDTQPPRLLERKMKEFLWYKVGSWYNYS